MDRIHTLGSQAQDVATYLRDADPLLWTRAVHEDMCCTYVTPNHINSECVFGAMKVFVVVWLVFILLWDNCQVKWLLEWRRGKIVCQRQC